MSGNTPLWSHTKGGLNFPITPPSNNGATPGTLDNTNVGATTPGTVDATVIGGNTPPNTTVSQLHVDTGTKTATAVTGAATLNKMAGVITSEALTTAAGADYTLTLTNSDIAAADQVMASVQYGTATTGTPAVAMVDPSAGSLKIIVQNIHASAALNGTILISFVVFKN
jgi:hypothetical protein